MAKCAIIELDRDDAIISKFDKVKIDVNGYTYRNIVPISQKRLMFLLKDLLEGKKGERRGKNGKRKK